MSDTEQQQAYTREDLEVLARWMGWEEGEAVTRRMENGALTAGETGTYFALSHGKLLSIRWASKRAWGVVQKDATWWNPFTHANADVQVLERAREVWLDAEEEERMHGALYVALAARQREEGWPLGSLILRQYRPGDYARAVLSVLRAHPEAQQVNDAD